MPTTIQPSFAKGEIDPALHGRTDTAAYQIALRKARNTKVHATGGISNRPGLEFVAPVKNHTYAPRLIPFKFKTADQYMLEFGDEYMRVMRNGVLLTETAKNIVGITNANPGVVEVTAHGYSTGDQVYFPGGIVGMSGINGKWFTVGSTTTDTFQLKDQVTGANFNTTSLGTYTSGGTVARVYQITTPYQIEDLDRLKYAQSADVMRLTLRGYLPYKLTRTAHTTWTLSIATFAPTISAPTGNTLTVDGADNNITYKYKVTAISSASAEESLSALNNASLTITGITQANPAVVTFSAGPALATGDEIFITGVVGMTQVNDRRFIVDSPSGSTVALRGENSTSHTAYGSAGTARRTFVTTVDGTTAPDNTIAWSAVTGAAKYAVYRQKNGIYGLIGETEELTFKDANITPDTDISPPRYREVFTTADSSPGAVGFYEQRLVQGGSTDRPDTSVFSQIGNYDNLNVSEPTQADDAITATLTAQEVNEIRHYVAGNDLTAFTSGSEWRINSGPDGAFTAATIRQKPQSYWGSSHRRPIVAGPAILFVTENNSSVRSYGFSLQIDGYTGSDMSLFAAHLFENAEIVDWTWTHYPDPCAYCVLDNGKIACLTFQAEQEVVAWGTWDTDGYFESAAALRHEEDETEDRAYFVVKRKINGNTVRYIERTHSRKFEDVRDCFFVDSGLSLDNPLDISAISTASPAVFTSASHGLSDDDEVDVFDIVWDEEIDDEGNVTEWDEPRNQLNGRRFTIDNATTDTFTLVDDEGNAVDGSDFETAYMSGGTVREVVSTISGLDHLEGETLAVLADGNVVDGMEVEDGAITLPLPASRVHAGLGYLSDIETLNVERPGATIQGKLKKVVKVVVRFNKSRGLLIGPDEDSLTNMKQRENEDWGDPIELQTRDFEQVLHPSWNTNGRIFLRQRHPLPMTILAIVPTLEVGETETREDQ